MTETWILYAAAVVWAGIGLYAAFLAASQRGLARRLARLEEYRDDKDS